MSMDRSAVEAIVRRSLDPMMTRLGIGHWTISMSFDLAEQGTAGECSRLPNYDSAAIRLNPAELHDEDGVLKTLLHELFHVVLSPFDLYSIGAEQAIGDDRAARAVLDQVWHHACERAVINLERLYVNLTEVTAMKVKQPREKTR
jgi:hypothetical protein